MELNFKDLLIELFVPLAAGNGQGRIGTGFPIARDCILTARHVLFDRDLDMSAAFEMRWHHWRRKDKAAGRWQTIGRQQIAFAGSDALDAAVIRHAFPPEVAAWRELTARNHATGTPWETEGFADIGRRDDNTREAVPMRGGTYQCPSRADEAWLDVVAPTFPAGWKGASGSPIIVLSRVAGLLTTVPAGFRGGRLKAIPASRLLEDSDFCAAIDYRAGDDLQAKLVKALERTRRDSAIAIGALECCIEGEDGGAPWRDPTKPVDELAGLLARYDVATLLRQAREAIRALKGGHPRDARALSQLVQRLLSLLYDRTLVDAVRRKVDDPTALLIGFPVATRFVAEAVMAGADDRETRYRVPQPGRELEGKLSLPVPPNSGIDPTGERTAESFREHLRRKLAVADLDKFESAFYRCMSEFVPASLRERLGGQDTVLRQMASQKVTDLAEHESTRHYYLFQLPREGEARTGCVATIERLKRTFPAVAFLELADDAELMIGEWSDFLPLEHILGVTED
jgi:hypothetical protein